MLVELKWGEFKISTTRYGCKAMRESDEWVCWVCGGLRWALDESTPEAAECTKDNGENYDQTKLM